MKTITPTELRENIYKLLDQVLETGVPVEIKRRGKIVRIAPAEKVDKFKNLAYRPEVIQGEPAELVDLAWEVDLDLP